MNCKRAQNLDSSGRGWDSLSSCTTPDAVAALRVVYEIHLIGEREREQQLYDLRSTMYFAIAIKGIAASPYGTTESMASWYNRSASARAPSRPMSFG